MNQRNLRSGGESAYNPEAAYNPKSFDERVAETREKHRQKSAADDVTDELSRVEKALDDLEAAVVDGDDEAAERLASGDYDTDPDDDADPVEKAAHAVDGDDLPNLPDADFSGTAADAVDDEPARVRKSDSWVGDVDLDEPTSGDPTDRNARLVDPDE